VAAEQDDTSADTYCSSVHEAAVPAGETVVLATVNIGMGPPPETPGLSGEMDYRLPIDVPEDGRVEIEVRFSGRDDCLRLAPA
jgi:hypothetical protein